MDFECWRWNLCKTTYADLLLRTGCAARKPTPLLRYFFVYCSACCDHGQKSTCWTVGHNQVPKQQQWCVEANWLPTSCLLLLLLPVAWKTGHDAQGSPHEKHSLAAVVSQVARNRLRFTCKLDASRTQPMMVQESCNMAVAAAVLRLLQKKCLRC